MLPAIKSFMKSLDDLEMVIEIKKDGQTRRHEAKTDNKRITQFQYFAWIQNCEFEDRFNDMQRIYVFNSGFNV